MKNLLYKFYKFLYELNIMYNKETIKKDEMLQHNKNILCFIDAEINIVKQDNKDSLDLSIIKECKFKIENKIKELENNCL